VISQHEIAVTENVDLLSVAAVKGRRQKARLDCGTSRPRCGGDIAGVPRFLVKPSTEGAATERELRAGDREQAPGALQHLSDLLVAGGENAAARIAVLGFVMAQEQERSNDAQSHGAVGLRHSRMRFRSRDRFRDLDYGWLHEGHGV
jgi:hypothetical protein